MLVSMLKFPTRYVLEPKKVDMVTSNPATNLSRSAGCRMLSM
jgi:hypothetical protein